jgi:hypothetical protein
MAEKQDFQEFLEEMLDLAQVPLTEQDEEGVEDVEDKGDEEAAEESPDEKKDETPEEELSDTWEITVGTPGTVKVEWHETYLWVWYRKRKSEKMQIPNKLRPYRKQLAEFMHKILSYVERVS